MDSTQNKPLTIKEAADYLGLAVATLYKMTMRGTLPFYKPSGGRVYFKQEELEAWAFSKRTSSTAELQAQALTIRKGR